MNEEWLRDALPTALSADTNNMTILLQVVVGVAFGSKGKLFKRVDSSFALIGA